MSTTKKDISNKKDTINKSELIALLRKNNPEFANNQQAEAVINQFVHAIAEALTSLPQEGGKITIIGFGTFSTVHRQARTGRNPRTGETMTIPESYRLKFTPGHLLNGAVSKNHKAASTKK